MIQAIYHIFIHARTHMHSGSACTVALSREGKRRGEEGRGEKRSGEGWRREERKGRERRREEKGDMKVNFVVH